MLISAGGRTRRGTGPVRRDDQSADGWSRSYEPVSFRPADNSSDAQGTASERMKTIRRPGRPLRRLSRKVQAPPGPSESSEDSNAEGEEEETQTPASRSHGTEADKKGFEGPSDSGRSQARDPDGWGVDIAEDWDWNTTTGYSRDGLEDSSANRGPFEEFSEPSPSSGSPLEEPSLPQDGPVDYFPDITLLTPDERVIALKNLLTPSTAVKTWCTLRGHLHQLQDRVLPVTPFAAQVDYIRGGFFETLQRLAASAVVTLLASKVVVVAAGALTWPFWWPWAKAMSRNATIRSQ